MIEAHGQPRYIVIDTYAAASGEGENDSDNGKLFIRNLNNKLRHEFPGVAVTVVHHPGKDVARGMRGSNSLYSGADYVLFTQLELDGNGEETGRVITGGGGHTMNKVKEGALREPLCFEKELIDVQYTDDDGEIQDVTSLVLVLADAAKKPRAPVKRREGYRRRLERMMKALVSVWQKAKAEGGQQHPGEPDRIDFLRAHDGLQAMYGSITRNDPRRGTDGTSTTAFNNVFEEVIPLEEYQDPLVWEFHDLALDFSDINNVHHPAELYDICRYKQGGANGAWAVKMVPSSLRGFMS